MTSKDGLVLWLGNFGLVITGLRGGVRAGVIGRAARWLD